ncbi:hypothetical protein ACFVAJ_08195 [Agromyces sp. NPDC057679]
MTDSRTATAGVEPAAGSRSPEELAAQIARVSTAVVPEPVKA